MPKTNKSKKSVPYETVMCKADREGGKFVSPYKEPRGPAIAVRLPISLYEWVESEVARRGCSKSEVILEALESFQVQNLSA